MAFLFLNDGIEFAAQLFLNLASPEDLTVRLYDNNFTPTVTSVAADFDETTLTGYSNVTLDPGDWSGGVASGIASYTQPTLTFTFSPYAGGTTIYGYFVTVPGVIGILAERFTTPYAVPSAGGELTLDITYEDQKLP